MKFRLGFVTNSSSSSFIYAQKGGINEKQKEAIVKVVEKLVLKTNTIDKTEDIKTLTEQYYVDKDSEKYEKVRKCLEEGKTIHYGTVDFEIADIDFIVRVYTEIWKAMEENGDGNFTIIDDDLSY